MPEVNIYLQIGFLLVAVFGWWFTLRRWQIKQELGEWNTTIRTPLRESIELVNYLSLLLRIISVVRSIAEMENGDLVKEKRDKALDGIVSILNDHPASLDATPFNAIWNRLDAFIEETKVFSNMKDYVIGFNYALDVRVLLQSFIPGDLQDIETRISETMLALNDNVVSPLCDLDVGYRRWVNKRWIGRLSFYAFKETEEWKKIMEKIRASDTDFKKNEPTAVSIT